MAFSTSYPNQNDKSKQSQGNYSLDVESISKDLIEAVRANNITAATFLLREGADPNAKHHYFYDRPLALAIVNNNAEMVKLLLGYKADLHASDTAGNNYLHLAQFMAGGYGDVAILHLISLLS